MVIKMRIVELAGTSLHSYVVLGVDVGFHKQYVQQLKRNMYLVLHD
jgi:hypothetical protein